ncbi:hypothetical protein H920_05939 [Fukomys damarensis]|uniref:Uncharacterized protein n=1 Tax=Fukomys damarensis TaxID=885580 RepID=A0A091DQW8_FUKDA|nr:hypothetical protein H920_05939 [Fukomys damarensis]
MGEWREDDSTSSGKEEITAGLRPENGVRVRERVGAAWQSSFSQQMLSVCHAHQTTQVQHSLLSGGSLDHTDAWMQECGAERAVVEQVTLATSHRHLTTDANGLMTCVPI